MRATPTRFANEEETLRLTDPAWFGALGDVARGIGGDDFYARLLSLFGSVVRHDMSMMVRYSRFSAPDFLLCEGLPHHFVELYRSGYYRYDPFYSYWQTHERGGVVSLREVSPPDLRRSQYRRVFQRQAHIYDELGIFLPGASRSSIALFLERSSGWFTTAEVERARRIYPCIAGLHRAHIGRIFSALGGGSVAIASPHLARPMLLVDRDGMRVYVNKAWREAELRGPELAQALARLSSMEERQITLSEDRVLHVEELEADFPLAPGGRMFAIERKGLEPAPHPSREVAPEFFAQLTQREREIVALILDGHPTSAIAKRLRISTGTVKNHRRRLYYRLDITTERELFLLYLRSLASTTPSMEAEPRRSPIDAATTVEKIQSDA